MRFIMHVGNSYNAATGELYKNGHVEIRWIYGTGDVAMEFSNLFEAYQSIRKNHHPVDMITFGNTEICRTCDGTGRIESG